MAGFLPYPCNGSSSVDAHLDLKPSGRIMWHLENIAFPFHLHRLNPMILLKGPYDVKEFINDNKNASSRIRSARLKSSLSWSVDAPMMR